MFQVRGENIVGENHGTLFKCCIMAMSEGMVVSVLINAIFGRYADLAAFV